MKVAHLQLADDPKMDWENVVVPRSDLGCHFWVLHALVVALGANAVIELGVRRGASTVAILTALDITGGSLWSADITEPRVASYVSEHPRWKFHLGDDLAAASFGPRRCDLLFIDTSHENGQTEAELEIFGPRVRKGGVIALHDTELKGVREPARAWAKAHGALFTELDGSYGLGVMRV